MTTATKALATRPALRYTLQYQVLADGYAEAIQKAGAMLRTGVTVVRVADCELWLPGWYNVRLDVADRS